MALETRLGDALLRLRYEDLLAEPETRIREVCTFLGEDFVAAMLEYNQTAAARKGAKLSESWQNTIHWYLPAYIVEAARPPIHSQQKSTGRQ